MEARRFPEQGLPEQGLPDLSARRSRLLGGGGRRGLALSTASTVVVLAALLAVFLLAPGSRAVRHTFFNPADMWRAFVGDPKAGYYSVGEALWLNIRMFVAAEILILILALVVAMIRQSTGPVLLPLRVVSTVYVDVALGSIEANKAAELFSDTVFNYSSYVVAAILFLILTIPLARLTDHLIRRDQARRLAGVLGSGPLWTERALVPAPASLSPRARLTHLASETRRRRCGSRGCASRSVLTGCSAVLTWRWRHTRSSA